MTKHWNEEDEEDEPVIVSFDEITKHWNEEDKLSFLKEI